MLNKAGSLRHCIDAPRDLLVERPNEPALWCSDQRKTDPQCPFPQWDISKLMREEGSPTQWGISRNCYSSSKSLNAFIWPETNSVKPAFWTPRRVRQASPKSGLQDDLHLDSKVPFRPLNIPTMVSFCHREITAFSSWKGMKPTVLTEECSGKELEWGYSSVFSLGVFFHPTA